MINENKLIEELEKIKDNSKIQLIGLTDMINTIKRLPKVGEWIPCSERLPIEEYRNDIEARGEDAVYPVLVTKKVLSYEANDMISVTGQAWFCKHGEKYNFFDKDMDVIDAIAWMPLPAPYNAERGGKNE